MYIAIQANRITAESGRIPLLEREEGFYVPGEGLDGRQGAAIVLGNDLCGDRGSISIVETFHWVKIGNRRYA
jgi:hypothetical protein